MAPDLALFYDHTGPLPKKILKVGHFFRNDCEKTFIPSNNIGDPVSLCKSHKDYLNLAGSYEEIHTNRLHFAISGLIMGTKVYLYANSYFKNKAVYDSWLHKFNCEFKDLHL